MTHGKRPRETINFTPEAQLAVPNVAPTLIAHLPVEKRSVGKQTPDVSGFFSVSALKLSSLSPRGWMFVSSVMLKAQT